VEVFASVEEVLSDAFGFSSFLDLQYFLQCLVLPHFHHFLKYFLGDLDLPVDLDLPPEGLPGFLSWVRPLTNKAFVL
jgi:hypothetical protein